MEINWFSQTDVTVNCSVCSSCSCHIHSLQSGVTSLSRVTCDQLLVTLEWSEIWAVDQLDQALW